MDPSWVYYVVIGGAGTLVGLVFDLLFGVPWWVAMLLSLLAASAFTWLTALDDVRRPVRSLRAFTLDLIDEQAASRYRIRADGLPIYGPPAGWPGERQLIADRVSYGRFLLSPTRRAFSVRWYEGSRSLVIRTVQFDANAVAPGPLPEGVVQGVLQHENELADITRHELIERLEQIELVVAGEAKTAKVLDLRSEGVCWFAEIPFTRTLRLELEGVGVEPANVVLVAEDPSRLTGVWT